eukprot:6208295-Pleurochrysis_carterae.AAC.5
MDARPTLPPTTCATTLPSWASRVDSVDATFGLQMVTGTDARVYTIPYGYPTTSNMPTWE